ncbi:MAG TPA: methyltransferase domain-containing protein [Usitatibacter sp.]|nr:methyltransferase domain-containing protein [Usitatibacter sp.]
METPSFPKRDPADAEFWDLRYQASFAPWDAGRVPQHLREFAGRTPPPGRVLVPGCGSAWDVRFLAELGWDVVGIDFSRQAVAAARAVLGPHAARVRHADFFAPLPEAPFALVYERAFLCALPRRLWPDWGRRVAQLVAPGGVLAGFFFYDEGERGPPFPLHHAAELEALLAPTFTRVEDLPVTDSIAAFAGRERWQAWRRQ